MQYALIGLLICPKPESDLSIPLSYVVNVTVCFANLDHGPGFHLTLPGAKIMGLFYYF